MHTPDSLTQVQELSEINSKKTTVCIGQQWWLHEAECVRVRPQSFGPFKATMRTKKLWHLSKDVVFKVDECAQYIYTYILVCD